MFSIGNTQMKEDSTEYLVARHERTNYCNRQQPSGRSVEADKPEDIKDDKQTPPFGIAIGGFFGVIIHNG